MLRIVKEKLIPNGASGVVPYIEAYCNSNDTPPVDVATGSRITVIDMGKTYIYDEDGEEWIEQSEDGAGGAGYDAVFVVTRVSAASATIEKISGGDFETVYEKSRTAPIHFAVVVKAANPGYDDNMYTLYGAVLAEEYGDPILTYSGCYINGNMEQRYKTQILWDAESLGVYFSD